MGPHRLLVVTTIFSPYFLLWNAVCDNAGTSFDPTRLAQRSAFFFRITDCPHLGFFRIAPVQSQHRTGNCRHSHSRYRVPHIRSYIPASHTLRLFFAVLKHLPHLHVIMHGTQCMFAKDQFNLPSSTYVREERCMQGFVG